ncbi:ATP-binding protein [Hymenobacter properus]|uniref:histidine kinase n=1 Tax=Hymenobacter properus TaxID=2791026 RepID=A0A931BIH4_9BACT|nr:ATP-binding protein [Hymenobacter properus]MBF9143121.1 tetratricopeptide repeat protein [Hymenobacter properus]MBR7721929.1 tetratricopeptide repeat protein [Microvirga sp. SRT04]
MQPFMTRPGFLLFWLLAFGWLALPVRAQAADQALPARTEALRQKLSTPLPDTTRLRLLNALCYALHNEQPARALPYGEAAVALARTLPANEQGPPLLRSLLVLASCYANLSNGAEALRLLSEAQEVARRLKDVDGLTRTYTAQGSVYHERRDSTTAWRHYRKALRLANQPGVRPSTRMRLLGNVGGLFFYRQQFPQALHYDSLALGLARREADSTAEANYLSSLATYQMRVGNMGRVKRLLTQALAISRRQHALRSQANQLVMLAMYYIQMGEPERTDAAAREALQLARQSGYLERVLDAYSILSAEAADRENYKQAYEWNQRYVELNDTLNNRQTAQTLAAAQVSSEAQERARRLRQLTEQHDVQVEYSRVLIGAVVVLTLALLVAAYFYRNLRRSRSELAAKNRDLEKVSVELRSVASFKDKLYAIVAHDLRGPVTAFAGVTSLIDSYIAQNDQAGLARLPAMVRQAADSLNHLLDNVLNWAVSQTGELECRPAPILVSELFAECQALYQTTAAASWQHITMASPDGLRLMADRNMARTILRNLVGNALKFMPTGGHVHLEAAPDPDDPQMVLISCTDTGPGMSAATVASLMSGPALPEPTPTPKPRATGLGLGLALSRAFVHRHGGTLVIQSRPGAGTNVTVSLPAAK